MMNKVYRSRRKPHSYLINTRGGFTRLVRIGQLFTLNFMPQEKLNMPFEEYEEASVEEYDELFDTLLSGAMDVRNAIGDKTFRHGNRIPMVLNDAKEKIQRTS